MQKKRIDDIEYNVAFVVNGSYNKDLTAEEVKTNIDIKNNYIRVEKETDLSSKGSYTDPSPQHAGANTGYYKESEINTDGSTTEGHEHGHSLGEEHDDFGSDLRGQGQPSIGVPRGTIVDPIYQYDPNAAPGAAGGTINPEKRKVTQKDINALNLDKLKFNKDGKSQIGKLTNIYHKKL